MIEPVPADFWGQIDHQSVRIMEQKPETFDAVRDILLDPAYDAITDKINRDGTRVFDQDTAFFAGSGGYSLWEVLREGGWNPVVRPALDYYVMTHKRTGETLTYIRGDVTRGDRIYRQLQARGSLGTLPSTNSLTA